MDIRALGYTCFSVTQLDQWIAFARDVLGVMVIVNEPNRQVHLRVDAHATRITLIAGEVDRLVAAGWEMAGPMALARAVEELEAAGVDVEHASDDEARDRRVEQFVRFRDPSGNPMELFHSPVFAADPLVLHPEVSEFVTDDMGLGHVVLPVVDAGATFEFYQRVLGFVVRDSMLVSPPRVTPYRMRFLACNPRHHSVALTEAQAPTGLRHLMINMAEVIDVGRAFDRANRAGVLRTAMGQHSNDLMLSFYAIGPGGIDIEVATLGQRHELATWCARELLAWKAWGYEQPSLATG